MRNALALLALLAPLALACDEPPPPEPEPEPEPVVETRENPPPNLEAIQAPSPGQANLAVPTLGDGWEFPVQALQAGFGKDDEVWLIELKPASGDTISMQLTFHGAELGPGTHRVLLERDGITHVFSIALGRTQLRTTGGEIQLEIADDENVKGTLDLEVRHPMHGEATHLRGRFHATHDRYYDAALDHERAIRQQLKRR